MSLRSRIMDRFVARLEENTGPGLAQVDPAERRARVLMRVEQAVLPRLVKLEGPGVEIRITAVGGRILAAHAQAGDMGPCSFDLREAAPSPDQLRDLDRMLTLACAPDMTFELAVEALDEPYDPAGIPTAELGAAAAETPAETAAPASGPDDAPAEPGLRPFDFLDACRKLAVDPAYFSSEGREAYPGRKDMDKFSPREDHFSLDAWHKLLSKSLGDELVMIVVPTDPRAPAVACAINGRHGVEFEFSRSNIGRVSRAAIETGRDE